MLSLAKSTTYLAKNALILPDVAFFYLTVLFFLSTVCSNITLARNDFIKSSKVGLPDKNNFRCSHSRAVSLSNLVTIQ